MNGNNHGAIAVAKWLFDPFVGVFFFFFLLVITFSSSCFVFSSSESSYSSSPGTRCGDGFPVITRIMQVALSDV